MEEVAKHELDKLKESKIEKELKHNPDHDFFNTEPECEPI